MTRRLTTMLVALLVLGLWAGSALAVVKVKLQLLADGLVHPLVMLNPPDGSKRLFIVEQSGTIQILMPDGKLRPTPFIDLSKKMVKLDLFTVNHREQVTATAVAEAVLPSRAGGA